MKEVAPFASHLAKTHPIYAELAAGDKARGKWMSPYNFALADCLVPPVIHRIERREGCIRVQATDNIGVVRMRVTVRDENGKILEMEDAARAKETGGSFPARRKERQSWRMPGISLIMLSSLSWSWDGLRRDLPPIQHLKKKHGSIESGLAIVRQACRLTGRLIFMT